MNYQSGIKITKNASVIGNFYEYALIVQQYYKLLHRYTCLVIPSAKEAEQIVVETMLMLWLDRHRLNTNEAVRSFLKKHTRRQCMNWLYLKTIYQKQNISKEKP